MVRNWMKLLACMALLVVLGAAGEVAAREIVVFVGAEALGASTHVNRDTLVRVVLPGNASTGHGWQVLDAGTPVLVPEGVIKYVPEGADATGGGRFTASFRAAQAGTTRIRLAYGSLRLPGVPPERIYELPVTVTAGIAIDDVFTRLDGTGDGRISREEFLHATSIPVASNEKGHVILAAGQMDRNGNGSISGEEVRLALFEFYDRNRDGMLDRHELSEAVGRGLQMFSF
jgi:predicted secreted protein